VIESARSLRHRRPVVEFGLGVRVRPSAAHGEIRNFAAYIGSSVRDAEGWDALCGEA